MIATVVALAAVALSVMACGSSNATGTETITGTVTGAAALAGAPAIPLRLAGPVNTTASITLGTKKTQNTVVTFKTTDGSLAVRHTRTTTGHELLITCKIRYVTTATYTVLGGQSTGEFAGATGSGTLTVTLQGSLPALGNGQCETSSTQPTQASAVITFHAAGPLTIRK